MLFLYHRHSRWIASIVAFIATGRPPFLSSAADEEL